MKVLPLRLEADLVGELDAAWGRLGHRNRMDFLRSAMAVYLRREGEHGVAERLVGRSTAVVTKLEPSRTSANEQQATNIADAAGQVATR